MGAQGTATLDFGAFPGGSDATVVITGQTGILAGSLVEAWLFPADTTDHLADEHMIETLAVFACRVVAGVGFTIFGANTSQTNEPLTPFHGVSTSGGLAAPQLTQRPTAGGAGTRIFGKWNVAWVWN